VNGVKNRKVSRKEALGQVICIMSGEVRDKGCPKAYCLKLPESIDFLPS
jgi:hypothetical protein